MKKISILLLGLALISFCSCSRINMKTHNNVILNHGETFSIDASSSALITYSTTDKYHADVNQSGLITANYVGKATITLSNGKESLSVFVTVDPVYYTYTEPDISFGESKSSVLSKLGSPYTQENNVFLYNKGNNQFLLVAFNSSNKVSEYAYILPSSIETQTRGFLSERYKYYDTQGNATAFINAMTEKEATMAVALAPYEGASGYNIVAYSPIGSKGDMLNGEVLSKMKSYIE